MKTWTARASAGAAPEEVLAALTDPEACARWAPLPFEMEAGPGRLEAGTRARVSGRVAGRRVGFDVEVHEADPARLRLTARGPVRLDVDYVLEPAERGSEVTASISVRSGPGLLGSLVAGATAGLLEAGALDAAVNRIARVAASP